MVAGKQLRITTSKKVHTSTNAATTARARQLIADAALETGTDSTLLLNEFDTIGGDDAGDSNLWQDYDDKEDADDALEYPSHDREAVDDARWMVMTTFDFEPRRPRYHDQRTRTDRHRATQVAWDEQIPLLATAYLKWKHPTASATVEDAAAVHYFHVQVISLKDFDERREIAQQADEPANVSLIASGLLGCSPINPTTAFTLDTLEVYHQIRRRNASFSIQAITKVLCALNDRTYVQHLRNQFSVTFDAYLAILRCVRQSTDQALGRDAPEWRLRNSCPPCRYKLDGEPTLLPESLHAMDGNSSAKRVDGAGETDQRIFPSTYLTTPEEVDVYKDEVARHCRPTRTETQPDGVVSCTDNWTVANTFAEETVKVFEQTGIFICACRHGMVKTFAEMRRSGELAKYGLAIVNKVLKTFGDNQTIGSDIGCSFTSTIARSSLGPEAQARRLRLAVNAFHGHAHNRACQLRFHPLYLQGLGLEDLETCERIFAASNNVAWLIRHASYYHWLQYLDLHFDQWDLDKYTELSNFMFNNYKQALAIIADYTPEVEHFKKTFGYDDGVFSVWKEEETAYLDNLSHEPEHDVLAVAYVEALEGLHRAELHYSKFTTAPMSFVSYTPGDFTSGHGQLNPVSTANARAMEAERKSALQKVTLALNAVEDLERKIGIVERWTPAHADFQKAAAYVRNRQFIRAVEALEGLVVQRLFELSKANLLGTGYKMRKQIAKAIARRSATLRTALKRYNELAPRQTPPRPILEYSDIINYAWLGDFVLLKHSRHAMLEKPWSIQSNREVAVKHFKILRAREEIHRLNVEVRRLAAWVDYEDRHIQTVAMSLISTSPFLSAEVEALAVSRRRVNDNHRARLLTISSLRGYSGFRPLINPPHHTDTAQHADVQDRSDSLNAEEDDALVDEVGRLTDFFETIT